MKEQASIYYLISGLMIGFGILFNIQLYSFSNAQLNLINIGAALITLSTTFLRILSLKEIDNFFLKFSKFNFLLGLVIIFLGIGFQGFDQNSKFVQFFVDVDSNPLVLICLGITVGSIANITKYGNDKVEKENAELRRSLEKMKTENGYLKKEVQGAADFINKLKRRENDE